jgi:nicotinamide-nucleotide amidase
MSKPIKAEIISIGTELLRGEITDTNAGYLASQLPLAGIELKRMTTAGDDIKLLCQVLRQALKRADLVITSGGLGPTEDDLTREAVASVLEEQLFVDPSLESQLKAIFARTGREMPSHNIQQATIIPSSSSLPNPRGTAPGWWVEKYGKIIVTLPGPPREMIPMWHNEVLPRLQNRFVSEAILARTVKTFSLQEAKVAELVLPFFKAGNPTLGIYAKPDGIQVRLIAHGENARQLLDTTVQRLQEVLHPYVWGVDDDTLEGTVGRSMNMCGKSLATMEDFTSGLLGHIITNDISSRNYYHGGLISGSDLLKVKWGLPSQFIRQHGSISGPVAEAMAITVREKLSADFGLSITGISSGVESTGRQPDTLFIGIADAGGSKYWQFQYMSGRTDSRERAAIAALFRLRERLIELKLYDYVK